MPNKPVQHVVLGAGPAGTTVAAQLAESGQHVRLVDRSHVSNDSRIESINADLSTAARAIEATAGADVLYHCVNVPYHRQVELMPGIAEAILAAANAHQAKLVVLDTLYPYGSADGDAITERTRWAATTRKGRLRANLDRRYLYSWGTHEARVVLGRSADFFGPQVLNSTLGGAFFPAVLTGQPAIGFGDLTLAHSYSYIPDVARGLIKLGSTDRGDGRIWHLPTTPAVSTREIHGIVARLVGHQLDVHVLDRAEPVGPFDATFMAEYAEMFYQHRIPQNMVSTRFEQHFGIGPTPLETALATTIEWYRNWLAEQSGRAS